MKSKKVHSKKFTMKWNEKNKCFEFGPKQPKWKNEVFTVVPGRVVLSLPKRGCYGFGVYEMAVCYHSLLANGLSLMRNNVIWTDDYELLKCFESEYMKFFVANMRFCGVATPIDVCVNEYDCARGTIKIWHGTECHYEKGNFVRGRIEDGRKAMERRSM